MSIETVEDVLMNDKISPFFSNLENLNKMLPIVKHETNISLRLLDWFVTNYCKPVGDSKGVQYVLNGYIFDVYLSYKSQLKAYSKHLFDPFCRRKRISFYYTESDYIQTTIGQLNFFKWFISNKILDYVIDHFEDITDQMKQSLNQNKKTTKSVLKKHSLIRSNYCIKLTF